MIRRPALASTPVRPGTRHRIITDLIAAVVVLAGCTASPSARKTPATLHIEGGHYVIPSINPRATGALIAARRVPGVDTELGSGARWQVLYHGAGPDGSDAPVSGQVLVPRGEMPHGGWTVVAWAHGTTGLAGRCAPSLAPRLGPDDNAVAEVRSLLAHGYAVVATDYLGLGTPGVHPYLVGSVNGAAVVDAVVTAHHLLPRVLSRRWAIVGHSEGGQSALFAAQVARTRGSGLDYRGVVALAPASLLEALPALTESTHDPVDQAYLTYAIAGLATVNPSIHLDRILAPRARAVLPDLTHGCIDQITDHFASLHLASILDVTPPQMRTLAGALGRNDDPDQRAAPGPILLLQGLADTDVPAGATEALRTKLVALGDDVTLHTYPGVDHTQLIQASAAQVTSWLAARFAEQ